MDGQRARAVCPIVMTPMRTETGQHDSSSCNFGPCFCLHRRGRVPGEAPPGPPHWPFLSDLADLFSGLVSLKGKPFPKRQWSAVRDQQERG